MKKYVLALFLLLAGVLALSVPARAEDNQLVINFTDRVENGTVILNVGDNYNPSEYAVAYKNGAEVPLTETGLGENGELLGFTVEGDDVETSSTGTYTTIYILRDSKGNQVTKKLTVRVEDKLEMDIENPIVLYVGEKFDPSLYGKAWRNGHMIPFGDFGPNGEYWGFIDNGDNVDTSKPGKYFVIYTLHGTLSNHSLNKTVDVFVRVPKLIVRYVDEKNNAIHPAEVVEGTIGETYYRDPITIDGYKYSSVIGENSGEFIAGEKTLTFVYATDSTDTTDTTDSTDTTDTTDTTDSTDTTIDTSSTTDSSSPATVGTTGSSNTGVQALNNGGPKSGNYEEPQNRSYPKTGDSNNSKYLSFLGGIIVLALGAAFTYKKVKLS